MKKTITLLAFVLASLSTAFAVTMELDKMGRIYELRVNDLPKGSKYVEVRLNERTIYEERTADIDLEIELPEDKVYCGETLDLFVDGRHRQSAEVVCGPKPPKTPVPVPVPPQYPSKPITMEFDEMAGVYELRVNDLPRGNKYVEVRLNGRTIYKQWTTDIDLEIKLPGNIVYCGETLDLFLDGSPRKSIRATCSPPPAPPVRAALSEFGGRLEVDLDNLASSSTVTLYVGGDLVETSTNGDRKTMTLTLPKPSSAYYCATKVKVMVDYITVMNKQVGSATTKCLPPVKILYTVMGGRVELEIDNLQENAMVELFVGRKKVAQERLSRSGEIALPKTIDNYYCHVYLSLYVNSTRVYSTKMGGVSNKCHRRILGDDLEHRIDIAHLCGADAAIEVYDHFEKSGFIEMRTLKVIPGQCTVMTLATRAQGDIKLDDPKKRAVELSREETKAVRCASGGLKGHAVPPGHRENRNR